MSMAEGREGERERERGACVALQQQQQQPTNAQVVHFQHAVHNWDVAVLDLKHHNLADIDWRRLVVEEENVAALERGLHATAQHDNDGALAPRHHDQRLPNHQRREHNHREVEHLVQQRALLLPQRLELLQLVVRRDHNVLVQPVLDPHRAARCAAGEQ